MKRFPQKYTIGFSIFLLMGFLAYWNPLQTIQWKISDMFFVGRGASPEITIIAIDDKSLDPVTGLGRFRDWPRMYYGQLLDVLSKYKPAVTAFDLDFRERSRGISEFRLRQILEGGNSLSAEMLKKFELSEQGEDLHPDDAAFQSAIENSGTVVLPSVSQAGSINDENEILDSSVKKSILKPIFAGQNILTGFKNVSRDKDGILRRFFEQINGERFFSKIIADVFQKKVLGAENDSNSATPINFSAKPASFRTLSFVDVLHGQVEAKDVENKIILIGATAPVLQDLFPTPTSKIWMPGVEIHANIIQQLIEHKPMNEQGWFSLAFILALFAICGSWLLTRIPLRMFAILFALMLVVWPAVAFAAFQRGMVLNVIYPELAWLFTGIAVIWHRNKTEIAAKKEIKRAFAHYVSPIVVDELAKHPEMLKLGGKRQQISVLFSDIVGFTTLAEKLTPEDTVSILNDYLTAMTEVVFNHHGTLDKYQGDAIMALFGAPLDDEHHAVNACMAAVEMRKALMALHEKWNWVKNAELKESLTKLDFRVGIATGFAVIGNVGSETRFDYTAIGDIVNLGSRLESVNRKYGTHVIVDKGTFTAVTENHNPFIFRKLDTVRVKGRTQQSEIFEVVAVAETATNETRGMLDDFENGRIHYLERNFNDAKQLFEAGLLKCPNDGPSQIYRNRCNFYLRKPPKIDWDGVVEMEEK